MKALPRVAFVVAALLPAGLPSPVRGASAAPSCEAGVSQGDAGHREPDAPSTSRPAHDHADRRDVPASEQHPPGGVPPITDADRAAAFPPLDDRPPVHDDATYRYLLFDQLEWQAGSGVGARWDGGGWIGGDLHRFWFRTEGEGDGGRLAGARIQAFYGRAIGRWWDAVVGVRQDLRPGGPQTWAAVGLQGLAPYWFEVELTAYLGASGRTQLQVATEYDVLLTNRLILQPRFEAELHGRSDPARGVGAGLSSAEAGLRIRYELRRELAPYVGVTWNRRFFGTADLAQAAGEGTRGARLALGVRVWF